MQKLYGRMIADPAKIPYPAYFNDIIGATIKIADVKPTGQATFSIEHDFTSTLFRPTIVQVRYIYIYY